MWSAEVVAMKREHAALTLVIDGLVAIIRSRAACNLGTLFRMARDARDAANALASAIERLCRPVVTGNPVSRFFGTVSRAVRWLTGQTEALSAA